VKRGVKIVIGVLTGLALGLAAFAMAELYPIRRDVEFQPGKLAQVVAAIDQGALTADKQGVVVLPAGLASVSDNGMAYVTKVKTGHDIVFVPSLVGHRCLLHDADDSAYEGYVYSVDEDGPSPDWEITGPVGDDGKSTASVSLITESRLAPHWYRVSVFS